jgi:hypothetical protein
MQRLNTLDSGELYNSLVMLDGQAVGVMRIEIFVVAPLALAMMRHRLASDYDRRHLFRGSRLQGRGSRTGVSGLGGEMHGWTQSSKVVALH